MMLARCAFERARRCMSRKAVEKRLKSKKPGQMTGLFAEFFGVADGTRTHDDRNHNPGLYQLSYSHH
jgi:hypothetical protein